MKNTTTAGTRCLPQTGAVALPGSAWPVSGERRIGTPVAAGSLRHAAFGGCVVYRTRFRSLINPDGIAMPVTHRMRLSASEP